MNLTKDQLKAILDATFGELENLLAKKPWLLMAVHAMHVVATSDTVLGDIAAVFAPKQ